MHPHSRALSLTLLLLAAACGGGGGSHSQPAFMQFREPSFSGGEDAGAIVVTVVRAGNTSGVVTVDYLIVGGTATDTLDYTSTSGTLAWDDGDGTEKTFVIPIHEDGCAEANETVDLALANPTGKATLGTPPTARVVILDNDGIPSGSLDPAFGVGGQVVCNPSLGNDAFTTATLDGSYLYAVGWDEGPGAFDWQWRIEKRNMSTGLPILGFGNGGAVLSNSNPGDATPFAVAADGGYLFIAGYDEDPVAGDWRWRTEKRSTFDGALDPGFGTGGVLIVNPSPYSETAVALAIDGSSLYLLGDDGSPGFQDWQWRIEKRSLLDGSTDAGFAPGGVVTSDPSLMDDSPTGMVLGSSHLYLIGYDHSTPGGDMQWRIEKRYLADGRLDTGFGAGGVLTSNPTDGYDIPYAVAADWDHLYIAGCDEVPARLDWQWRIEKRSLLDGSLDPAFGLAGVVQDDPSPGDDEPWSMVIDSSFMYLAGYDQAPGPGDEQWRILKLSLLDGSPDPCFGSAGMIQSNPGINGEIPWWITQDSSSLYVVGEDRTISSADVQLRVEKRRK